MNSRDGDGRTRDRNAAHLEHVGGSASSPAAPPDLGLVDQRGALLCTDPVGHHVGLQGQRERETRREGERGRETRDKREIEKERE